MKKDRPIFAGILLGAVMVGLGLAAGAASASLLSDTWITAKLKMTLVADPDVSGVDVGIDTHNGLVTLHGLASSEMEKTRAEGLAREVGGVLDVRNLLQVVPDSRRAAVAADDQAVRMRVERALAADPTLTGITVRSVNLGVVLLGGEASSAETHLRAIALARGAEGVRRVESEISGADSFASRGS